MIISSCRPTGSSCLIPPPNLEPIPAAMINNVVFILHLICFFFVLLYFDKTSIAHSLDFVGNSLLCILFYTESDAYNGFNSLPLRNTLYSIHHNLLFFHKIDVLLARHILSQILSINFLFLSS